MAGPVILVWMINGCPIDLTRSDIVGGRNVAEMHGVGPGPAGGGIAKGQPATIQGGDDIGTGVPDSRTLGFGAVGFACPPCAQVTVAVMVTMNPGIR